jgi:hypothetical protein
VSIWLPPTRQGFTKLENAAADLQTPVVGILVTPSSHGSAPISQVASQYKDFTFLLLDGRTFYTNYPNGVSLFDRDPKIQSIAKHYPYRVPVGGMDMVYYSDRAIRSGGQKSNP